ncbi:MAG: hypothetical protein ACHQNT_02680 [Bacteroidia bacterium]
MNDALPKKGSILNPSQQGKTFKNISILITEKFEIYLDGKFYATGTRLLNAQHKVQLYAQEKFDSYKIVYFTPHIHIPGKLGFRDTVVGRGKRK